jgi:arylsulfatase A-like enzyme
MTADTTAGRHARPNVLFIFSDEHRACSFPGEPYCDVQATHLARLAREGISFRNCISNYPVCSPYRAMLLSGRWPFQTGVVDNSLPLRDDEFSLGEVFRRAGYRTGYIGKWHLSPRAEFIPRGAGRHGFEDWQPWFKTSSHFGQITFDPDTGQQIRHEGYGCTLMTDAANDFIGAKSAQPWMLVLSWVPPHPPFGQAPPELMRLYYSGALQFRPNVPVAFRSRPKMKYYLCGYYAHISALDLELGRLLDKLDRSGEAADTIVVYTSDHGTMLGSHGLGGKRLPFDEACRVPFVLRYPRAVPANASTDVLLGAIDLFPSLCGLAGVPVPAHCEGSDLSDVMRGGTAQTPQGAFLMHIDKANAFGEGLGRLAPLFRGIRTDRCTYAVADDGRWCLFDEREDPYQTRNLIDEPAYARIVDELNGALADWLRRARDSFPLDAVGTKRSVYAAASGSP